MRKDQRALLIGMILGDGCLNVRRQKENGYVSQTLQLKHCARQTEYLEHKACLLHSIFGGVKPTVKRFNNSGYPGVRLSKSNKYFVALHRKLYPGGKKTITVWALSNLSLQAIALWYMDDGSLTLHKRAGKIHAREIYLNTYCTLGEAKLVRDYFSNNFLVNFRIALHKGKYRLACNTENTKKFISLVAPYIIPSMAYKIDMKYHCQARVPDGSKELLLMI